MNVYIIAASYNISFAEKLLYNIRDVKIISKSYVDETDLGSNVVRNRKMESADVILVIIDDKFSDSRYLNLELRLAQIYVQGKKNMILLPVVLDKAGVPKCIEKMFYISCDSKSEEDLLKAQMMVEKILTHRNFRVREARGNEVRSKTSSMIILTLAIEMFAMFFVILLFKYPSSNMGYVDSNMSLLFGCITVVISVFTLITSYLSIMRRRWQEDDEEEIESYSRRLKKAIVPEEIKIVEQENFENKEKKKEIDALGRMMINLEDIKEFYTWSQKQAKASFILAVMMCILGFVLMIAAFVLPVVFRLSFQMSIIPAVGGVITELIAGTALVVYRNSLSQLNHYHKALHEDERFLSSVNLLGKFSTVKAQDDMLREIIRSEIQMNIDGLKETENIKLGKSSEKENSK